MKKRIIIEVIIGFMCIISLFTSYIACIASGIIITDGIINNTNIPSLWTLNYITLIGVVSFYILQKIYLKMRSNDEF